MTEFSRRRTLAVLAGAAVAGCTGGGSGTNRQSDTETAQRRSTERSTPTTTQTTMSTEAPTETPTETEPQTLFDRYDLTVDHSSNAVDEEWSAPTTAPAVDSLGVERVAKNLEVPWDLSFGGDGTLFVTERVGRLLAVEGEAVRTVAQPGDVVDASSIEPGKDINPYKNWFIAGGEDGVLGVATHPGYPDPPVVYVYYTVGGDRPKENRVVAIDVSADAPFETAQTVVGSIPANDIHNGGRITFGPRNYLWICCGDAGKSEKAQDPAALNGSILRVTPTGDPAPDNPGLADPRIYTYGHRNPQGIVFLPDGTPLANEHGPDGRDEINRLVAGHNYGWPDVYKRSAYPVTDSHPPLANSGKPSWAPTGSVFYTGDAVPTLQNRMLIGGLWSQQILVATLTPPEGTLPPVGDGERHDWGGTDDAYTVTTHAAFEGELGRVRHVEQGPNGELYAITSNRDGRAKEGFPRDVDDVLVRIS